MRWKSLLLAACLVLAPYGCSVEQNDDVPDINVETYERDYDPPDLDVDVDIERREERVIESPDSDLDIDAQVRSAPAPDEPTP